MTNNQERPIREGSEEWQLKETAPVRRRFRIILISGSSFIIFVLLAFMAWFWVNPNMGPKISLSVGSQLFLLYGALVIAIGAFQKVSKIALMSTTFWGVNRNLFAELMKSKDAAIVGIYFIMAGFFIQAVVTLLFRG